MGLIKRRSPDERRRYAFLHDIGVCAATGVEGDVHAAHIRGADFYFNKPLAGMAIKPHWIWTLPLSPEAHREQHAGNEKTFWEAHGFGWTDILTSPLVVALALEGYRSMNDVDGARRWLMRRSCK